MRTERVSTEAELRSAIDPLRETHVFRGQVRHYEDNGRFAGFPSSFARHGCIPRRMRRWACYSHDILVTFGTMPPRSVSIELSHSLLQHYGWRSFFVDLTVRPEVAAWFGCNAYKSKDALVATEDCHENDLMLLQTIAQYVPSGEETGNLYAIDRAEVARRGIGLHRLMDDFAAIDCRPTRQSAVLAGPVTDFLDPGVVTHRLEVPTPLLRSLATSGAVRQESDLFPSGKQDPLYASFLREPWIRSETGVFTRSLDLPVFGSELPRFDENAYWQPRWVTDDIANINSSSLAHFRDALILRVPADAMFGYSEPVSECRLGRVHAFLNTGRILFVEADGIYQFPVLKRGEYIKGVVIQVNEPGTVDISDLTVECSGTLLHGWGINASRRYRWDAMDRLVPSPSQADCPCNYELRHLRQLETLCCLEPSISRMQRVSERNNTWELKNLGSD